MSIKSVSWCEDYFQFKFSPKLTRRLNLLRSSFISTHLFKVFSLLCEKSTNVSMGDIVTSEFPSHEKYNAEKQILTCRESLMCHYPGIHDHSLPNLCQ